MHRQQCSSPNNYISSNGNVCLMTGAIFISDDLVSVLHAISLIQHHVIWLLKHCAITLFSYLEIRCICSLLLKIHRSDEDCKRILNHCHKLTTCYGFETLSWDLQAMWSVSLWQWFWHFPLRPSSTDNQIVTSQQNVTWDSIFKSWVVFLSEP